MDWLKEIEEFLASPDPEAAQAEEYIVSPEPVNVDDVDHVEEPHYEYEDVGETMTQPIFEMSTDDSYFEPDDDQPVTAPETIGQTEQFDVYIPQEEFSSTTVTDSESYRDLLLGGE